MNTQKTGIYCHQCTLGFTTFWTIMFSPLKMRELSSSIINRNSILLDSREESKVIFFFRKIVWYSKAINNIYYHFITYKTNPNLTLARKQQCRPWQSSGKPITAQALELPVEKESRKKWLLEVLREPWGWEVVSEGRCNPVSHSV